MIDAPPWHRVRSYLPMRGVLTCAFRSLTTGSDPITVCQRIARYQVTRATVSPTPAMTSLTCGAPRPTIGAGQTQIRE